MEPIQYVGEHLLPGRIGHFGIIAAFVSAILASIGYFFAESRKSLPESEGWLKIGRGAFAVHGLSLFAVIGVIFYLMIRQYFEYQYVWAHVSEELPLKYIFSAFWEGQEGSFLLWMFWHVVLGMVLMIKAKTWEAPTLAVLSLIQAVIVSMILGIYLGFGEHAVKIGSNPLLLLRQTMDAPIFNNAEYLKLVKGNGLNPLLQNYWMTIHPPTLFLGFASTSVPFAFAIAGLWTRRHHEWLKPALPWALFSGAILGTGILMGGAWAYEALSFGGYWAWDPVENMSLVPWLTLLAGIHTNLVANQTGQSVRSAYVYYLLTFGLIVYSTFLTRSGVLGDTSVHAFTEMGLEWQLIFFLVLAFAGGYGLFFARYRGIPSPPKEEPLASREFWMFIGSLVLLFSALIITASTSLPVFNKIMQFFNPAFQGRVITEPVAHYNKNQLYIGVFIGFLSGLAQYLRYREWDWKKRVGRFSMHLGIALALSFLLTYLSGLWIEVQAWQYWLLMYAGIFTVVSNGDYLIMFLKGNMKAAGSALSHAGFGIMIVGILASGLNKKIISNNPFIMDGLIEGADDEALRKNILLFKNAPTMMAGYELNYVHDTLDGYTRTYTVNFKRKDAGGKVVEEFNLHPNILYDKSFTKIAASNPSTKRYWNKDIFTHIASLATVEIDLEQRQAREDSLNYRSVGLIQGREMTLLDTVRLDNPDTTLTRKFSLTLQSINRSVSHPDYRPEPGDLALSARVRVEREEEKESFMAEPAIVLRNELMLSYPAQINELSARLRLTEEFLRQIVALEEDLNYQDISLGVGEEKELQGVTIRFAGFNRQPANPDYQPQEGDLPVGAQLSITDRKGNAFSAEPVFLIRDGQAFDFKDMVEELGLHLRFPLLDPKTEKITLRVARSMEDGGAIPVEMATNSLRSDYIVLEAIEFPGINLFWLGSSLMMVGLAFSMGVRLSSRKPQET